MPIRWAVSIGMSSTDLSILASNISFSFTRSLGRIGRAAARVQLIEVMIVIDRPYRRHGTHLFFGRVGIRPPPARCLMFSNAHHRTRRAPFEAKRALHRLLRIGGTRITPVLMNVRPVRMWFLSSFVCRRAIRIPIVTRLRAWCQGRHATRSGQKRSPSTSQRWSIRGHQSRPFAASFRRARCHAGTCCGRTATPSLRN
jgi:hypothetical protein